MSKFHTHKDENGLLVKCYHKTRSVIADYGFWIGVTVSFPIEHFIWEKIPGFSHLAHWMGM